MKRRMRLDGPIKWTHRTVWTRYGLHWAHGKGGRSVVLKTDISWRTISGVMVNTPKGAVWVYFRNWGS